MHQDASSFDAGDKLTPPQEIAVEALLVGMTASDAAASAGAHRTTLHRWLGEPDFVAYLNLRRKDLRDAGRAKLLRLQDSALATVEDAITSGDAQVAIAVLKGVGLLDGRQGSIGPTDPASVERIKRAEARDQEFLDQLLESAVDPWESVPKQR